MNRRKTLKKLALASGALVALPAWANGWRAADMALHPTSFSPEEQELLASVADTIIPAGNAIGALTVGVDKFLQRLFDDCYEQEVQENIKAQLNALERSAQKAFARTFSQCNQKQREEILGQRSDSEDESEKSFFDLMKSETIRGFTTSREVMVDYHHYQVAPGHYYGCVDVNA